MIARPVDQQSSALPLCYGCPPSPQLVDSVCSLVHNSPRTEIKYCCNNGTKDSHKKATKKGHKPRALTKWTKLIILQQNASPSPSPSPQPHMMLPDYNKTDCGAINSLSTKAFYGAHRRKRLDDKGYLDQHSYMFCYWRENIPPPRQDLVSFDSNILL